MTLIWLTFYFIKILMKFQTFLSSFIFFCTQDSQKQVVFINKAVHLLQILNWFPILFRERDEVTKNYFIQFLLNPVPKSFNVFTSNCYPVTQIMLNKVFSIKWGNPAPKTFVYTVLSFEVFSSSFTWLESSPIFVVYKLHLNEELSDDLV